MRDYNIFTNNRDRLRDALTLPPTHPPGTYFEYAQSPVAMLAEATAHATGEDFIAFAQRELMDPLGIKAGSWNWTRDNQNRVLGYMGVQMRPDDYARLGELLRRDGVWQGQRLLSHEFVARNRSVRDERLLRLALGRTAGSRASACASPTDRSTTSANSRTCRLTCTTSPGCSASSSRSSRPRESSSPAWARTAAWYSPAARDWEHDLYAKVLGSVTDQKIVPPGPAPKGNPDRSNADYGFQMPSSTPGVRPGRQPRPAAAGPVRSARGRRCSRSPSRARLGAESSPLRSRARRNGRRRGPTAASGARSSRARSGRSPARWHPASGASSVPS